MEEEIRYCVCMKKSYKIFNVICLIILFIAAIGGIVLGDILISPCLILMGCIGICSITKRVEVYKGKIVYCNGLKKKEYKLSDIYSSKTATEEYETGLFFSEYSYSRGWDIVTTFYNKSGKILFQFGYAYKNAERLTRDSENAQKSIAGNMKSKNKK